MKEKIQAVRKIGFDAGHRVFGHQGKCRNIHGHRYTAEIYAEANKLNNLGMVIDFSMIKKQIGAWINCYWDHNFIVYKKDKQLIKALQSVEQKKEIFIMDTNPTAENMASYLLNVVCPEWLENKGIEVTKIRLFETPNCYVEVTK